MQLIANFIKQGVPLKESLVFALKRKREGSRSSLLLYTGIEVHTVEGLIDLPDGALERVVLLVAEERGVAELLFQHIDFLHGILVGGMKGLLAYSIAEKYVSVSTIAYCSQNKKCVSLHLKYKDERYV